MDRQTRSNSELEEICLRTLRQCPGFEQVNKIVLQGRVSEAGFANWTVAAVRPRVHNNALRSARRTIDMLQKTYQLDQSEIIPRVLKRRA